MFVLDWLQVRDTDQKGKLENVKMIQPTLNTSAVTKMKHFLNYTKIAPYFDASLDPMLQARPVLLRTKLSPQFRERMKLIAEKIFFFKAK